MIFQLPATTQPVVNEPPADLNAPRIPGAIITKDSTKDYRIVVKVISGEEFSIHYHTLHFFKNTSFEYSSDKQGLLTHAALTNTTRHTFPGIGRMKVRKGQYNAMWCECAKGQTRFNANEDYTIFDIFYSPKFAVQYTDYFKEFGQVINSGKTIPLSKHPKELDITMRDTIRNILNCPYDERLSARHFASKADDYLMATLYNIYHSRNMSYRFSDSERDKIYDARDLLLKDFSKPPYTISELAKAVGLNELRLKVGFQYHFRSAVFETFLRAKMEMAYELVDKTDKPIKEIARLTGYALISGFEKAFMKTYGYSPSTLRRNRFKV